MIAAILDATVSQAPRDYGNHGSTDADAGVSRGHDVPVSSSSIYASHSRSSVTSLILSRLGITAIFVASLAAGVTCRLLVQIPDNDVSRDVLIDSFNATTTIASIFQTTA